jgi:DNA primase
MERESARDCTQGRRALASSNASRLSLTTSIKSAIKTSGSRGFHTVLAFPPKRAFDVDAEQNPEGKSVVAAYSVWGR